MLSFGEIDSSKVTKGSKFELRFFRGGKPEIAPSNLDAYTFAFTLNLEPPTAAEIAAAKAAADKKIADEKAAAEKAIADKAAADKLIADKAAAAAKAAAAKKKTITCVKGKLTKKVTAVKPVCPSGYKKK